MYEEEKKSKHLSENTVLSSSYNAKTISVKTHADMNLVLDLKSIIFKL